MVIGTILISVILRDAPLGGRVDRRTLLILWLSDLTLNGKQERKPGHSMFLHSNADYKNINQGKHPQIESDQIIVPVGEDLNDMKVLHNVEDPYSEWQPGHLS